MVDTQPHTRAPHIWRKSSYSGGEGDCVEVAAAGGGVTHVRDSKDREGPVLTFSGDAWRAFVAGVEAGEFRESM
ncbi:DUF397 domain-containing protein [Streptomyces sp. NPDC001922]|uniref:DUF397 domain-containing protein n=1 Tax=Streptomyces sp. NPDC001922 TaxID=3364624 RepID=UPI0036CD4CDC